MLPATPSCPDRLLSVRDVADYLNVKTHWIYDAVESGYLPCRRFGKMLRFTLSGLENWLTSERLRGCSSSGELDGMPLMSVDQVMEYLGVSRSYIYEARRSKGLPHFKLGRHLRFSSSLVEAWLAEVSPDGLVP